MAVSERRTVRGVTFDVPVSHLVVRIGDVYIDYMGVQTRVKLLRNLVNEGYQQPTLREFGVTLRQQVERESDLVFDVAIKNELVRRLRQRYG